MKNREKPLPKRKRIHSQELKKGSVWEGSNLCNWQPLQHFQLFSQRLRSLKVKPKRMPKSRLQVPITATNRQKTASPTKKHKTTKNLSGIRFRRPKGNRDSWLFGSSFEAWAILGPKWSPSLPREPPGRPQTLFFVNFGWRWHSFLIDYDITKPRKCTAKLFVFETIVCSAPWQTGLKKNIKIKVSRIKGTVAAARSALREIFNVEKIWMTFALDVPIENRE